MTPAIASGIFFYRRQRYAKRKIGPAVKNGDRPEEMG
jgi:hypothetical protein